MGSAIGGLIQGMNPQINTGNGNDNVHISKAEGLFGALGYFDVSINGKHQMMTKDQLESKTFNLGGGDDTFTVDANVDADLKVNGGDGNDTIIGGRGNDTFSGGAGNDTILGGAGSDTIHGGTGNDYANGGDGSDTVYGDSGDDILQGGLGNDVLIGGRGNDVLSDGGAFGEFNTLIQGDPNLFSQLASANLAGVFGGGK